MSNPFGLGVKDVVEAEIKEAMKSEAVTMEKLDRKIRFERNGQTSREILIGRLIQMLSLGIGMVPTLNIRHGGRLKRNMDLNPFRFMMANLTFRRFLKVRLR